MKNKFGIDLAVPLAVDMEVGKSFGDGVSVHLDDLQVTNMREIRTYLDS